MEKLDITQIRYAGWTYSSSVILDCNGDLILAPSLYLADLSLSAKSANTISSYAYHLCTFFEVLKYSGLAWEDVKQEHITAYINKYLRRELKLKEASIKPHIAALQGYFEYVYIHSFISNPMKFKYPLSSNGKENLSNGVPNYITRYIPDEKFNELLSSVDSISEFMQERDELVLLIGYYMGLRASEIVDPRNLRIDKLLISGEIPDKILITGKGEKTRGVNIPFVLKEKIIRFIKSRLNNISNELMICSSDGNPLTRGFASKLFLSVARSSKDPFLIGRSFHSLRHTYATNLVVFCYGNGLDPWIVVPEQMGHSDKETTFGYIFFEAVLNNRHSLLKKLSVKRNDINFRDRFKND